MHLFCTNFHFTKKNNIKVDEKQITAHLHELDKPQLIAIYNQLMVEKNEIVNWNYLLNKNTYKYFVRKKVQKGMTVESLN